MSLSRGLGLFKRFSNTIKTNHQLTQVRHGGDGAWSYRKTSPPPKFAYLWGDVLMGFTVWWILWHFWHDFGHIVGEFDYPDPSKWTDAELGVPPDDEE